MYKFFVIFLLAAIHYPKAESAAVSLNNVEEARVLNQFFRMGFQEEEYGYVVEGVKPVSVRNFYSLDAFPVSSVMEISENEFMKSLLVQAAASIWNKFFSSQKNFVLKIVSSNPSNPVIGQTELRFVNITKLREVIEENIALFRYVLGPDLSVEKIVNTIVYSDENLLDILKQDLVLMGIVLGFGSYNSLVGGRIDQIIACAFLKDCPPFLPKSRVLQKNTFVDENFSLEESYGSYYLAFAGGEKGKPFRKDRPTFHFESSFLDAREEFLFLRSLEAPIPTPLKKLPAFIFSAFAGDKSNEGFFDLLKQTQKKVKLLNEKPDFLIQILKKIVRENVTIDVDIGSVSQGPSREDILSLEQWKAVLSVVARRFEGKCQERFALAFCNRSKPLAKPKWIGISKQVLNGLQLALKNFSKASDYFELLHQSVLEQGAVCELAPKGLYCKTTLEGSGEKVEGMPVLRVDYTVENLDGKIIFADYDAWIPLSKAIPSFVHGMQGMRVGEKREIFIHPSLGYGFLTTLSPCDALIMKVHLLEVEKSTCLQNLPSLDPLDLNWIEDLEIYNEFKETLEQRPEMVGAFYREVLSKISDVKKEALVESMRKKFCLPYFSKVPLEQMH